MKNKKLFILLLAFTLTGCNSVNSKYSENKEALELLKEDNAIADIVIDNQHYTLLEPLSKFLDNNWKLSKKYEEYYYQTVTLDNADIGPMKYAEIELRLNDSKVQLTLTVLNPTESETIKLIDASVIKISFYGAKEFDSAIMEGGITIGTSESKMKKKLDSLNIDYEMIKKSDYSIINIKQEDPTKATIALRTDEKLLSSIDIIDSRFDNKEAYTKYNSPDDMRNSEQNYINESEMIEGTVEDYYYKTQEIVGDRIIPVGGVVVIETPDGIQYAINLNTKLKVRDVNLTAGDNVKIYYQISKEIADVDGSIMTEVFPDILIVNQDRKFSIFAE